jgi:hypothetical protein
MPAARQTHVSYMREMMERLGLDPAESVVPHYSLSHMTALHRCAACTRKQACRDWLDHMPGSVTFAPSFCPNANIFFELQFDHLGRTHAGGSSRPEPI